MTALLLWWLALAVLGVLLATRRGGESPLLLTYFLSLSMIHVPGALNYMGTLVPLYHERETYEGFRLTLIGLTAMLAVAAANQVLGLAKAPTEEHTAAVSTQTAYRVILIGALTYFLLGPLVGLLPSGASLAASLSGLLPLGFWFWAMNAAKSAQPWLELIRITFATMMLPVATVLVSGFMGLGVALAMTIAVMVLVAWPRKLPLLAITPLLAYLGISLGATYFLHRDDIRVAVWGEQDYAARVEASLGIFREFRFYDVNDPETVSGIEARLNGNVLIGIGLQAHENGFAELQYGATVPLWSLIPRALWPDKPVVGGGRDVVSSFIGVAFADGTSVGAGNPLEFYINFGWPGVVGGFMLLGLLLSWHDQHLFAGLRHNDLRKVVQFGLPGLALIQPGGNLIEVVVSFVAALFVARGFVLALGSPFVARMLGFNAVLLPTADGLRPVRTGR